MPPETAVVEVVEYAWKFKHPKFGWIGGDDQDFWTENRVVIQSRISFCPYPCQIVERLKK